MGEFEFYRNITIGQYLPFESVVHRMDPRAKILAFVLVVAAVAMASTMRAHTLILAMLLLALYLARVPLGYSISGIRPALPVLVIMVLVQLLLYSPVTPECPSLSRWGWINITTCRLTFIGLLILRLGELIVLTSLLTLTTMTTELAHGIERLLGPLQRVGFPAHELALTLTIALRFVPTLARELERLVKAQVSRGADFGRRGWWDFPRRIRMMVPLLVPLFLVSLRRAEELVLAMEARLYMGGRGRTTLRVLQMAPRDYLVLAMALAVLFFILVSG